MPFRDLPQKAKDMVLHGSGDKSVKMIYADDKRSYTIERPFEGVVPNMERWFRETDSNRTREELSKYQAVSKCEVCDGARLKPEARAVKINGKHISEVADYSIGAAVNGFPELRGP